MDASRQTRSAGYCRGCAGNSQACPSATRGEASGAGGGAPEATPSRLQRRAVAESEKPEGVTTTTCHNRAGGWRPADPPGLCLVVAYYFADTVPGSVAAPGAFRWRPDIRLEFNVRAACIARLVALAMLLSSCISPRQGQTYQTSVENALSDPHVVSLLGRPLVASPPSADRAKLEAELAAARKDLAVDPDDADKIIWVGRRLGYLWRMNEAIELYTRGIELHADYALLYRHRGHRYISVRRFDKAIADLERAAELIQNKPDMVEPDGTPNQQGVPLATTGFNVWYHLGLARYLTRDFEGAFIAFREAKKLGRGYDDNLVATTDWMYMALCRLGRDREAAALLDPIRPDMDIIENHAYHRRLLVYKGHVAPEDLLDVEAASELDLATLGYGLGNWYLCNGDRQKADRIFKRVTSGPYWPAFGFIAAEVELARKQH